MGNSVILFQGMEISGSKIVEDVRMWICELDCPLLFWHHVVLTIWPFVYHLTLGFHFLLSWFAICTRTQTRLRMEKKASMVYSPSLREAKARIQGRNMDLGIEAGNIKKSLLIGLFPGSYSTTFIMQRSGYQWHPPSVGWALLHQLAVTK